MMYRQPHPGRPGPRRQRGAALAVGLILLAILTMLAITSFGTATTELVMAGNEQFRKNAQHAATAGIEQAIARIGEVGTAAGAAPRVVPPTPLPGSADDTFGSITRFVGDERGLPQSSADKFVGLHFVVESTGASRRGASDAQVQGVLVVAPAGAGGVADFGRIGAGLGP